MEKKQVEMLVFGTFEVALTDALILLKGSSGLLV